MKLQHLKSRIHRSARSGQIAVLTVGFLVFFLGVAGLAVDVGQLWNARRQMQTAADAAAIAAVNDLAVQDSTDLVTDAYNAAAKNGFANGGTTPYSNSTVTVSVQSPPTSGTYSGNPSAVAVQITQNQPTQFLKLAGFSTIPIKVTASGLTTTGGACVYSTDPSGSGALTIAGTSSLSSACGIYVDSNSSSAAIASGGGTITGSRPGVVLGVVGGTSITGGGSLPVTTSIPAFGDPLSYIAPPAVPACTGYPGKQLKTTVTEVPKEYCGGLQILAGANVTFSPGLYIINGGGLMIASAATVTGNGVTFYITGDNSGGASEYFGVTINGGANVQLSAPNTCGTGTGATGGSIQGILFFQDRSIVATGTNASTINGGATSFFNGALYFPTTALNYAGSSASSGYTYVVSYDLKITGNAQIGNNYTCLNGQSLINNASLVL